MELWDLYNKNREKTGEVAKRGSNLPKGRYHLVVHICIINSNGEMLIQKRQADRKNWPNKWDLTVGGSVVAGETSTSGAKRELMEEIGYIASLEDVRPFFTMNFERGFDDYYIIKDNDVDISKLKLQVEEVQCVKWATKDEILEMIKNESFVRYENGLIDMIFSIAYKL